MAVEVESCKYFNNQPIEEEDVKINDYSIHYKRFGNGPCRLMMVMGLNGTIQNFFPLINHFSNSCSVLVFDNRGAGKSTDGSAARYTTKGMAQDAAAVLEAVGWTQERTVHLVGISMGGMISQELAYLIPKRFRSLTLLATYAYFTWPSPRVALGLLKPKRTGEDDVLELMARFTLMLILGSLTMTHGSMPLMTDIPTTKIIGLGCMNF